MTIARRRFLQLAGTAAAGALAAAHPLVVQAAQELPDRTIAYAGSSLQDWATVVGDGVWCAPGEPPVSSGDIETLHFADYSELRANVSSRRVEAHNLTHQSIVDPRARFYLHTVAYDFRLPYVPAQDYPGGRNAQTLEGGLGLWDGAETRIKYGVGFQWGLNPYSEFGDLRIWTGMLGQGWQRVGRLAPDTAWHHLQLSADFLNDTATLQIDQMTLPACIGKCPPPPGWGNEVAVGPSTEIISIYPGESGRGGLHLAQIRNWAWVWTPLDGATAAHLYLPSVSR